MHKQIILRMVAPDKARYDTCGDWFTDENGDFVIQVTEFDVTPNVPASIASPEAFLIALHELVEWRLCMAANITQAEVDDFDKSFNGDGEPGDDVTAPYRDQHRKAMIAEHMMADWLGMKGYGRIE
jgi:hypothetical protein